MKHLLCLLAVSSASFCFAGFSDPKGKAELHPSGLDLQLESLKKQAESLKRQLGNSPEMTDIGFEWFPHALQIAQSDCAPLPSEQVESLIDGAAKKQSLSTQLLRAIMRQESGFKPCAISIRGAQGLMQLMPATAALLHVSDPFDPEQNVQGGATFLKQLLQKYKGDLRLALVAYNAGANKADQLSPSEYPLETQAYLANILAELDDSPAEN